MTKVATITKSMLDQLEYDTKEMSIAKATTPTVAGDALTTPTPTVMLVFARSDLNAAAYHLAKSLESPFAADAVATLLVEEAAREDFLAKLLPKLKTYSDAVTQDERLKHALSAIERLKAKTITAPNSTPGAAPTLVCDVTHEYLGSSGGVSGVVTLHTFRTAKEAITLCAKESWNFSDASIWQENHAYAYELVAGLRCRNFFLNCWQVSLAPLKSQSGNSCAILEKSYHYETLASEGGHKNVVFPVGSIFAN